MSKFQIYTYMFHPMMENQLEIPFENFEQVNVQDSINRKQEILHNILDEFADNSKKDRKPFRFNGDDYSQRTYIHRDGITVMRIANNKKMKIEQDFNVVELDNHPSCLVIIDNRKDRQVIAIERNKAFNKTELVGTIIQTTLRQLLAKSRLSLDVKGKYHTAEFWQVISSAMTLKGIESVEFPFPYPNLPEVSDMVGSYFTEWARRTNSEPTLHLEGQNGESVRVSKEDIYILQAIKACAARGRPILIKPKGSSIRKIGVDSPVLEEVPDVALKELDKKDLFESKYQVVVEFLNTIKLVYE